MPRCAWVWTLSLVLTCSAAFAQQPPAAEAGGCLVLSQDNPWRRHCTFSPPVMAAADGTTSAVRADSIATTVFQTPPPKTWVQVDFDPAGWLSGPGPEFTIGGDPRFIASQKPGVTNAYLRGTDASLPAIGLLCQRGSFTVSDPKRVRSLSLSLTYRGGFVAYLNGKEVARSHLPAGAIEPTTPAEAYQPEALFTPDSLSKNKPAPPGVGEANSPVWAARERSFGPKAIPAEHLKAGLNVLALEFHRAAYPEVCRRAGVPVGLAGMSLLELRADAPKEVFAAPPATPVVAGTGPADIAVPLTSKTAFAPEDRPRPVRIVAARNGTFSGQAALGSAAGAARCTEFVQQGGAGRIPATVRYTLANPLWAGDLTPMAAMLVPPNQMLLPGQLIGDRADLLVEAKPAEGALSVWISVQVPKDAKSGLYRADLSIGGSAPPRPVELLVTNYTLPDMKDYATVLNIYQSPDTLAEYYKLQPWSPRHWEMIEKSLALIGRAGNIGVFVPLLAQTQFGNPESMVVWLKQADGTYKYDFSRMDQYLALAKKTHPRLKFVCAVAWGYEASLRNWKGPVDYDSAVGALVSVRDAEGKLSLLKLPRYGTKECEDLLAPLLHAFRDRLKETGVPAKLVLGITGDRKPEAPEVAMFRRILPDAPWICEAHLRAPGLPYDMQTKAAQPVYLNSIVYGGEVPDPAQGRKYGWQHKEDDLTLMFNRSGAGAVVLHLYPPPWSFHMWMESTLAAGRAGNGRVGGDFWRIGAKTIGEGKIDWGITGGSGGSLYNRYVHSHVDETGLGRTTSDLLGPSPEGPVSTVRLENALEGVQEAEARVELEKALLDKARPLPAELAKQARALLDERTNILRFWQLKQARLAPQDWQERNRRLFELAGQVQKAGR